MVVLFGVRLVPSVSKKQERFMQAVAHNPAFAKKAGVPQSVGKEFTKSGGGILLNTVANEVIYLNQRFIYTSGPTLTSTGHLRIVRIG